ncbi:MAG TPA: polysaccharide deacetylase family protein, partial [Limnochordia bacterium]
MVQAVEAGGWPAPGRGAISLTFDDGMASHLEKVVPLLARYRFLATFYLMPRGDDWQARLEPWRPVAAAGHEIGNHTTRHLCSRQKTGAPRGPGSPGDGAVREQSSRLRRSAPSVVVALRGDDRRRADRARRAV